MNANSKKLCGLLLILGAIVILLPIFVSILAVFTDNANLSGSIRQQSGNDRLSFENAIEKFEAFRSSDILAAAFIRTLIFASLVSGAVSFGALISGYVMTRVEIGQFWLFRNMPFLAYFTPPIVLVIALAPLVNSVFGGGAKMAAVALGQMAYFFPLCYALAVGHWLAVGYEYDRCAAVDGAGFLTRLKLHFTVSSPSFAFFCGLWLLTFMLCWGDVLFSRYLLGASSEMRLLPDLVIEQLNASDLVAARGELSALAVLCFIVSAFAAFVFSIFFNKTSQAS